jgi:hypothetical protein
MTNVASCLGFWYAIRVKLRTVFCVSTVSELMHKYNSDFFCTFPYAVSDLPILSNLHLNWYISCSELFNPDEWYLYERYVKFYNTKNIKTTGQESSSSVSRATGCGLDCWGSIPNRASFISSTAYRLTLGPTQTPIQCVQGSVYPGGGQAAGPEAGHLKLVPRSRMVELYLHSPIYLISIMPN